MRKILYITLLLTLIQPAKAQMLYYQDTYKGGASFDGRAYFDYDYLQPDTIVFQNAISVGSTIRKAYLISQRLNNWVVGSTPIADIPLHLIFNGNSLIIDSADIVTNYYNCDFSNPSGSLSTVVKDVTSYIVSTNNILVTPCQACNTLDGQPVYNGFWLLLLYNNNAMPTVNAVLFLNNNTYSVNMTHNLTNINPINTINDVALSINNNCTDKFFNYQCNYNLDNGSNAFPLGTIFGGIDTTIHKLPGSFYYENNILHGLVDDTPDAFIDSTDALANIKTYIPTNATTFSLTSTGNVASSCDNERICYVLAYSTPCPARSNADSIITYVPICSGNTVQLHGASVGNYTWSAGNNSLNNYNIANPVANPTVTTNYIAYIDSAGCKHTEQHRVNVYTTPKADSAKISPAICGSTQGTATIVASAGSPVSYTVNNTIYNTAIISNLSAGTYTFALSNAFGCHYTSPKAFVIKDTNLAKAAFYPSSNVGCAPLAVACNNLSNNSGNYTNNWVWYANGDSATTQNFNYTFADTGTFVITLLAYETYRNCSATASQTITVNYCPPDSFNVTVPNVFTPNNDGTNDTWQVSVYNYQFTVNSFECSIYDRWGKKVFETDNITDVWSGGKENAGTYFYIINYKVIGNKGTSKEDNLKGFIELIK